ncbi:sensor histidine kinase [Paenibacillus camerounensis]|uniref:sensor histidine kinase n=1 Tax=Paenibacillus camerounensis TaxID=1243663 RepID=UPI000B077992|nr:ATP-binding protein [Paenibacillus camerounensis]
MITFFGGLVVALLLIILWQFLRLREHGRQLRYIQTKLTGIMASGSHERLLLFNSDPALQQLLAALNALLNINHKGAVERAQLETSMRHMLANISHDLKTPLTVVLGYIETLLQSDDLPAGEREVMLRTIHTKAQEVIALMNRFFDLAKLESGDKEIPLGRVELGELCRRNILSFYELLSTGGSDVQIEIPDEPLYIMGNEEALDRVLGNLLSNAITYGADGGVLGLRLFLKEEQVCIEVWDKGKGIAEMHQDKIFERLYTMEDSRNREYQGSGLGLTITKRLTEQMNGSITLTSKPYVRTAFTLSFRRLDF